MILKIDLKNIEENLKWEVSRDDQIFPHLYGFIDFVNVKGIVQKYKNLMNYKLISKLSEFLSPEIFASNLSFFLKVKSSKMKTKFSNLQTEVFGKFLRINWFGCGV